MSPHLKLPDLPTPILIAGLGISGKSILRLIKQSRVRPEHILTLDENNPTANFRSGKQALAAKPRTLILSPGIPLALPWVKEMLATGVLLTSELDLAFRSLTTEHVIGVTGSVGKSTVTAVLGAGLRQIDPYAFAGGNIGIPLADYIYRVTVEGQQRATWLVLELSSYQLENSASLQCETSVFTSLTPNHLDRYPNKMAYYEQKLTLLERTRDLAILNRQGYELFAVVSTMQPKWPCKIRWTDHKEPDFALPLTKTALLGTHNKDNLAVALKLAQFYNWPEAFTRGALAFRGLPHRTENFGEHRGVLFINDSKATTVTSVGVALASMRDLLTERNSCYVLLGGRDKSLPWADLGDVMREFSNLKPIFFGEVADRAKRETRSAGPVFPNLRAALQYLFELLKAGDLVMLSPGGTSHDEFLSFEERGEFFRRQIEQWSSG